MLSRSRKACDNCRGQAFFAHRGCSVAVIFCTFERNKLLGERSCFYVSDVGWLVVEMGVLHSIVEEGERAWLGFCFDRQREFCNFH